MPGLHPENPHAAREPRSPRRTPPHSEPQPSTEERPVDAGQAVDPWDIDLAYLDAVDRASALSFPASDPPAFSRADSD